jgi:hypothetical protein
MMTELPRVEINRAADVIGSPGASDVIAAHRRIGKVVSIDTAGVTCTVRYGQDPGSFTDIPGHHWLDGAEPAAGEYVYVLSQDGAGTIIGKIATAMASPVSSVVPACHRTRNTAATLTDGVESGDFGWNLTPVDTDAMAVGSAIEIQTAGIYRVKFACVFSANSTGRRFASIYRSNVLWLREERPAFGQAAYLHMDRTDAFTAGETISLRAFQSSGGSLTTTTNDYARPFIEAVWQSAP